MRRGSPIRVGLAGCGLIAQWHHLPVLARSKDVDLVAVCDKDEGLASGLAGRYGVNASYADFSRMLAHEDLDAVDVCTPPRTHAPLSIEALEAGCHVLIEKPMALSLQELDQVVEASRGSGKKICQVHHMLFEPTMLKARHLVRRGFIGEFLGVDVRSSSRRDGELLRDTGHWAHQLPAGILTESLAHPLYLAAAFMGRVNPVAIHARKGAGFSRATEVRIVLQSETGIGGVSYTCSSPPKDKLVIDVYGKKGNLRVDLWNAVITRYGTGSESLPGRAFENAGQARSILAGTLLATFGVVAGRFRTGHQTLIKRFIESVKEDTEPPVTIEEARNIIEVLEKVAQST